MMANLPADELQLLQEEEASSSSPPQFQSALPGVHGDTNSNNVVAICENFCVKYNEADPLKSIIVHHEINETIFQHPENAQQLIPDHIILNSLLSEQSGSNKNKRIKSESLDDDDGNSTEDKKDKDKGRKRTTWSEEEKQALLNGYKKHGSCYDKWRKIQSDIEFGHILQGRTNVDLKDKYRNIFLNTSRRSEGLPPPRMEQESADSQDPPPPLLPSSSDHRKGETTTRREKGGELQWTEEEKSALLQGYERHGASNSKWMKIKHDPDFSEILSRRSNVDLKDKYRNIQLSMNRFGYTFKKEKDGLGPPGHDYGILAGDGGDTGLIEQSSCNILRDLMNHNVSEQMDNQQDSSALLESAMELSGFAIAPDHYSSQQHMMSGNLQYLLECTQQQQHHHQQQQSHSHMQQHQLLDHHYHLQTQQHLQLQPIQLQHQDFLRENGRTDHIIFQTMCGDPVHTQLLSESVVLLPNSAPYAALEQMHPLPLLPQLNSSSIRKAGRKRKESQQCRTDSAEVAAPSSNAAAEPKQKKKRGRPPFKPTAVDSAPVPAPASPPLADVDHTLGATILATTIEFV